MENPRKPMEIHSKSLSQAICEALEGMLTMAMQEIEELRASSNVEARMGVCHRRNHGEAMGNP
jgi:hypothetical protein